MEFFYTGSEFYLGNQTNIDKSLGGYLSSSKVPNNSLANVFSDISYLGRKNGYVETKGIVLKNTTGAAVTNIYLYHNYPTDCLVKLEWAAVSLVANQKMEKITTFRSTPYVGTFVEPSGVSNKVLLSASLADQGVIGLWVKRTIKLPDPLDAVLPKDLEAYLAGLSKREDIEVVLDYN